MAPISSARYGASPPSKRASRSRPGSQLDQDQVIVVCAAGRFAIVCPVVKGWFFNLPVSRLRKPSESFLQGELVALCVPLTLFLISLGAIGTAWWWLGMPVNLARAPI